jgi:copper homeostasis protein
VLLEVPVASVEDALATQEGVADRLELNAALSLGGLTPSLGTLIER